MAVVSSNAEIPDVFPRPFGRYQLLAPLAQGGMGSLFLACQGEPGMEKLCVVKTVLPALADKEYVSRFRDEAKVVVRLSHGNLVPVFDAGQAHGELYVAMDFVDGKDLRAVWNRCARKGIAFPVDVAVHIVRELARGLHHAHTAGNLRLVHRDVSPPNVLLAFSGEVKLTDFGLASSILKLEKTAPGVIYGKVSYMAPEQARGDELDGRTDLYAAGIILWELLTGRQLFPASEPDVLNLVRAPRIDAPSRRAARVPARLDAIVLKALAADRNERYGDCEAFRVALAEFLAREAPATDTARVASFLRELFDDEIEKERAHRQELVEKARQQRERRPAAALAATAPDATTTSATPEAALSPTEGGGGEAETSMPVDLADSGMVGRVIAGRYQIVRHLGEGGMGKVYEAEHIEIGKRVAVKLLHPHYSRAPDLVARFRREARAASRIGHPNIVDVTDSGTTDAGEVFFVMEYLEGCDLARVIQQQEVLTVDRAVHITIQLSRALAAAHTAGIVHRDLKPENVFLVARPGQPDFVKVLDFGIARQMDLEGVRDGRLTDPGIAMGTPEYMAPEQASGQPTDHRADIYSVGAILYEMLSGHPPHEGKNLMEVLTKKAGPPPPSLVGQRPDVNEELAAIVARSLMKEPDERQQTMEDLALALERCRPDRRAGRRREDALAAAALKAQGEGRTVTPPAAVTVTPARLDDPSSEEEHDELPVPRPWLRRAVVGGGALLVGALALAFWRGSPAPAPRGSGAGVSPGATRHDPPAKKAASGAPAESHHAPAPAESHRAPPAESHHADEAKPAGKAPAAENRTEAPAGHSAARRASPAVVAATGGGDGRHLLDEGRRLLKANQLDAAEDVLQRAADGGGDPGAALTGLAEVAFRRGNYAEAVRRSQRAVRRRGGITALLLLADSHAKVHDYEAAANEYRQALRIQPGNADVQKRLEIAERKAGGG